MTIRYPDYYRQFRCLAGQCPDSCCKDWAVQVDELSAAYYRSLPGKLGDDLRIALQEDCGETILTLTPEGRCPMWQRDGLCRIQAMIGEDHLCQVCKTFPRLRHDYGDFVELGLELSCPEAARLILQGGGTMLTEERPETFPAEYDGEAMEILLAGREELHSILTDHRFTPNEALAIMLLHGCHVQTRLDGGEPPAFDPVSALAEGKHLAEQGSISDVLTVYAGLEILTPAWKNMLEHPKGSPWTEAYRALAQYGVDRYYLQAVSDYDLMSRGKFGILSCLVIRSLGGDLLTTAQLYAKEIENDADNVDALLDAAYTHPAFTDRKLLGLLLS